MSKLVSHKEYLLVEVPEDVKRFFIGKWAGHQCLDYYFDGETGIDLPIGSWQIIGKADQLDNEQWNEIVDQIKQPLWVYWKDYVGKKSMTSPTASGLSLLASHDMKASETLIIKKI